MFPAKHFSHHDPGQLFNASQQHIIKLVTVATDTLNITLSADTFKSIPDGHDLTLPKQPTLNPSLVQAIGRAYKWRQEHELFAGGMIRRSNSDLF